MGTISARSRALGFFQFPGHHSHAVSTRVFGPLSGVWSDHERGLASARRASHVRTVLYRSPDLRGRRYDASIGCGGLPVHASRAYQRRPTPSAISVERGHCAGAVVAPISPPGCTRVRLAATALQDRICRVRKGTLRESGYATARGVRRECAREAMALRRRGGRFEWTVTRGNQITRGACATRG